MESFKTFYVEKNVLGLEETITIDGVGSVLSKLDTGNGAFNVLHGVNIKFSNGKTRFETVGGILLTKDVSDTVTINLGAGNSEERPVVSFDVKIGGKVFKDIPFSIGDRSGNNHKVLIGKLFIQNELDALIDVGLSNVANKQLQTDYA